MRFTSIIVAGALAMVASAQDTTGTSSVAATAATTDAAQASSLACLDACADGDVACQSKCIAVSKYRAEVTSESKGYLSHLEARGILLLSTLV